MIRYLENDFKNELGSSRVLVDFYADWCGPCRMLSNELEEIEDIDILKVNVDKFSIIAQQYGVISIPMLIIFENGKPVKSSIGFLNHSELKEFIK